LVRALKNIPNISVSSKYFIPPMDEFYFASKDTCSFYCYITFKRAGFFDGIKEEERSEVIEVIIYFYL